MSMPLTQPFVPPTDFDAFLEEIGLGILPQEDKDAIAMQAREMTAAMVVEKIAQRLSPDKQQQTEKLMDEASQSGNHIPVNEFLLKEIPGIDGLVDEAIGEVKAMIRAGMRNLPQAVNAHMNEFKEAMEQVARRHAAALTIDEAGNGTNQPEAQPEAASTSVAAPAVDDQPVQPMQPTQESAPVSGNATFEEIEDADDEDEPFPWENQKLDEDLIAEDGMNQPATPPTHTPAESESEQAIHEELNSLNGGGSATPPQPPTA